MSFHSFFCFYKYIFFPLPSTDPIHRRSHLISWHTKLLFSLLTAHWICPLPLRWTHPCSFKSAAFVFTEPCTSFFSFVIIFTLILCWQAHVFDGVTWGQILVPLHCVCHVFDVISWSFSPPLTLVSAHHFWLILITVELKDEQYQRLWEPTAHGSSLPQSNAEA